MSGLTLFGSSSPDEASGGVRADVRPVNSSAVLVWPAGLLQPIWVTIEQGIDEVALVNRATGIFGIGTSVDEASEDLVEALLEHRRLLETDVSERRNLSHELVFQLGYLRRITPLQ